MIDKVKEQTESMICELLENGIDTDNIEILGELIDIHKDVANEEYWEAKEENLDMMYRGRNSYGDYPSMNYGARHRDNRGRYMGNEQYGRRYKGHEMIDEMTDYYGEYMANKESGRYGSPETHKALEYMLESVVDFIEMLKRDASSQEEIDLIHKYAREISEM